MVTLTVWDGSEKPAMAKKKFRKNIGGKKMKCPILSAPSARKAETEGIGDIDCTQADCAWWLEDIEMCCMRAQAFEARRLQQRLADLIDREKGKKS